MFEAEKAAKSPAVVHRDERASDGRVAVGLLSDKDGRPVEQKLFEHGALLLAGDYDVTVWMEPKPLSLMHSLAVTIQAGRGAHRRAEVYVKAISTAARRSN